MKSKIDHIFFLCSEVGHALCKRIADAEGNISYVKDYALAYNYFRDLLNAVFSFSNDIWGGKKPFENDLAVALLDADIDINHPITALQPLKCHVYQLGLLAEKLLTQVIDPSCSHYDTIYHDFCVDTESLLALYEFAVDNNKYNSAKKRFLHIGGPAPAKPEMRQVGVGRRDSIENMDFRFAINALCWLDVMDSIDGLPFRELRPSAVILMRQAFEMTWRNIIGYQVVVDQYGYPMKQFTQVGWKFISNFKRKDRDTKISGGTNNSWSISLPIPIKILNLVNSWCNAYTHNPSIPPFYVEWYVLEIFWSLSKPSSSGRVWTAEHGAIHINGFKALRKEFELYVAKENSRAQVVWLPDGHHTGAFVDDEGEDPGSDILRRMRLRASWTNLKNIWCAFRKECANLIYTLFHKA